MNNSRVFLAMATSYRQKASKSFRNFHSVQVLGQHQLPNATPEVDRSLFFTNLPNKRREKKVKKKVNLSRSGMLIIDCKNKELNHYSGMHYGKFEEVPLASKGWGHRKARGDYFTILPKQQYSPFLTKEDLPDTFEACGVGQPLIDQLKKIKVSHPTAIQAKILGNLLPGGNAFVFGECGSGKTVAYVIAMIESILQWKHKVPDRVNAPLGIIITNSRELALQVMELASCLGSDLGLNCLALLDGHIYDLLKNPEMKPVDILVCTAKALNKHLTRKIYSTKYCKHVVVDDADTFEVTERFEDLQTFFRVSKLQFTGLNDPSVTGRSAQICFVSAVAPSSLQEKLRDLIQMAEVPVISTPYLHHILYTVPQHFIRVSSSTVATELLRLVKSSVKQKKPTLIFSNGNKTCNWASLFLAENGVECVAMNKETPPTMRVEHFRNFELGFVNVLCATNMLSMGFHFPQVKHVISLEFPKYMSDYIHRCGRVGRLGQVENCLITNLIRPSNVNLVQKIELAVRTNSVLPNVYCPAKY